MANTQFNAGDKGPNITLSGLNLTATVGASADNIVRAVDPQYSGKYYVEFAPSAGMGAFNHNYFGVMIANVAVNSQPGVGAAMLSMAGVVWINNNNQATTLSSTPTSIDMAVDLDNKLIWFRDNNGNWNGSVGADPATATGGYDISSLTPAGVFPFVAMNVSGVSTTVNFGDSAMSRAVPSGFTSGWPTCGGGIALDPQACGNSKFTGLSSSTISLNTSDTNRIVLLFVYNEKNGGAPTVSSVTDTAGLTWNLRKRYQWETSNASCLEIWWAKASAKLTGNVVTVTLSGTTDDTSMATAAVWGASRTGRQPFSWYISGSGSSLTNAAWDSDVSLSAVNNGSGTAPTVTFSTSGEDMVFGVFGAGSANAAGGGVPAGPNYQGIEAVRNNGGTRWAFITVEAKYSAVPLTGDTATTAAVSSVNWGMIADALTSAPALDVARSFAVTIG